MKDVFAAYLTNGGQVGHSFMRSLAGVMERPTSRVVSTMAMHTGAGQIAAHRNLLTTEWLDNTTAEWMWWTDTDMGFAPDTLDALLTTAEEMPYAGVVGALAFSWKITGADGLNGFRCAPQPTIYGWDGNGFRPVVDYRKDAVIRCAGTGAACLLIHRSAAEKVAEEHGSDWWTPVRYSHSGEILGEDLSFCYRLGESGIPVHVDTKVKTSHAKTIYVSEADWDIYHRESSDV